MDIQGHVGEICALYASGQSTEHRFRPALAELLGSMNPALTYGDIRHYQRIVKILAETDRIMLTIELPLD